MPRRENQFSITLTKEQQEAVKAAFPGSRRKFAEQLRALIRIGILTQGIEWPPSPPYGGKRNGAGRKTIIR
jgi:hypothetical protein